MPSDVGQLEPGPGAYHCRHLRRNARRLHHRHDVGDDRAAGRRAGRAVQGQRQPQRSQPRSRWRRAMIPFPNISVAAAVKAGVLLFTALALVLLVHDRNHWKSEAGLRQQQLAESKAAFDQTVTGYRTAAAQARAADSANAARVKSEQTAISERTANEFE